MTKKTEHAARRSSINFIWFGVAFSILYWLLEAFRDVFVFSKGTIFERIFYPDAMSIWMRLLVVCIIILFSARTQSLSNRIRMHDEKRMKSVSMLGVIRVGLEFGILYWILESLRDAFVFGKGPLLQRLVAPEPMGFWMRILAIFVLLLFSLYAQSVINAQLQVQRMLREKQGELEDEVKKRTKEVDEMQSLLEQERKERERLTKELEKTRAVLQGTTSKTTSTIKSDLVRNRIYVTLSGSLTIDDAFKLKEQYILALQKMRRGFDVLVDATHLKPSTQEVQKVFEDISRLEARIGLGRIVRVEGETPLGAMQLDRISKNVAKTQGTHFKSVREAENFLDQK